MTTFARVGSVISCVLSGMSFYASPDLSALKPFVAAIFAYALIEFAKYKDQKKKDSEHVGAVQQLEASTQREARLRSANDILQKQVSGYQERDSREQQERLDSIQEALSRIGTPRKE